MEKRVTITKIRLDNLKYFEECREDETDDFFRGEYTADQLKETFMWMVHSKYISNCGSLKYKLNEKGLELLKSANQKIEEQTKKIVKVENARWWDRVIDNGQKILNIIFVAIGCLVGVLTYIQVQKSSDIRELRELRVKDSLQFSTTLRDLQNQLTQQNTQLQSNQRQIEKYDSLFKSLKVKK